jgi:hypothetical protein
MTQLDGLGEVGGAAGAVDALAAGDELGDAAGPAGVDQPSHADWPNGADQPEDPEGLGDGDDLWCG